MKRIIMLLFIIIMMLALTPNVFAASNYGEVKDITEKAGDSLTSGKGTIETKGDTTYIRYGTSTFKMLEENQDASDGERPGPAAWIGFEVTEPSDDSDSKFKVTTPDNKTTEITESSYKDYVGITPTNLKKVLLEGKKLTYKYSFDWNEDDKNDQYVIIEIDPEKMTLLDTNGEDKEWSPEIAKEVLEENPNTGDLNLIIPLGLILIAGIGLVYYFKKA